MIVEFGVDVTEAQRKSIIAFLRQRRISFYQTSANAYLSLEQLKSDCDTLFERPTFGCADSIWKTKAK